MCGILGWIDPTLTDRAISTRRAEPALAALERRGPDDRRIEWGPGWILGHTRLAIIDLTHRASQPMTDGDGLWLVYNGEIYNFRELRAELTTLGCRFVSSGDAEVLLQALKRWGPSCIDRLRGMFAFALLDTRRRELILARDRYGVKPLAYEARGSDFRFASDLFALRALPEATLDVDSESAYLYMALGYVPAPHSIHPRVRKVKPGHFVRFRWSDAGALDVTEHSYWSMGALPENGGAPDHGGSLPEFERHMSEAVGYRLISDVPLGTLLSGGIDSTLVTAVSREIAGAAGVPSFTMGFDDPAFDERPFARPIAQHLGGNHADFQMGDPDIEDVWGRLWSVYDEPFADCSALPTLMLSRLVSSSVKVALTGDGGDEVFCGYSWHQALDRLDPLGAARGRADTRAERMTRFRSWHRIPADSRLDRAGLWSALRTGLSDEMLALLPFVEPLSQVPLSEYFREWSKDLAPVKDCLVWAGRMDLLTYLPDDLMVKADRASMSVGLELREPLLDHQLTAWGLRSPVAARFDRETGTTKLLPRRSLEGRLPPQLLNRPKQGFTPPLKTWLAGPLSGAVNEALERLRTGQLEPLALPGSCESWVDCESALQDRNGDFLWRVMCFSEWKKRIERAA